MNTLIMSAVVVTILNAATQLAPPSSRVEYEVHNGGEAPIWLVDDDWLIWNRQGKEIELSFKRGTMRVGAQVYGYFPPAVFQLRPGQTTARVFELQWPQRLDRLWNSELWAAPPAGRYKLSVSVGYGVTPAPGTPALGQGVEAVVLNWQRVAVSEPVPIQVPPHEKPAEGER